MDAKELNISKIEDEKKLQILINGFSSLKMGDSIVLISDSDLTQILDKINNNQMINHLEWENVVDGPDQWQTVVTKRYMNFI